MFAALALAAPAPARADDTRPDYTVSVGVPGLVYRGVAVELERDLPAQRISVAGGVAVRSTAAGDYDSTTIGAGGEVRYWLTRWAIWTQRPRGSAIGGYVAARLDLSRTSVTDAMDEAIGAQTTTSLSLLVGYRLAPWRGLEVRPYTGIAVRRDGGGRLAPWARGGVALGLAVGWSW